MEVLLYSAILAMLLGFAFVSAWEVFASSRTLARRNELAANQEFIERRVGWIMAHGRAIEAPAPGMTSTAGFTVRTHSPETDPAVFLISGGNFLLSLAGRPPYPLNSNRVSVREMKALHAANSQVNSALSLSLVLVDGYAGALTASSTLVFPVP